MLTAAAGYPLRCCSLRAAIGAPFLAYLAACDPTVVIGAWTCAGSSPTAYDAAASVATDAGAPISIPWSTGFEDGFCDYTAVDGFCYETGTASFRIVTSPVHSGRFAAAFTVTGNTAQPGTQSRCVRQGVLPAAAYYGAWYYVPTSPANMGTWNLFHFQGGSSQMLLHGLWDVSLVNGSNGALHIAVFDFLRGSTPNADGVPPIPIGSWFHLEIYFKRAADMTGEVAVYQDGQLAIDLPGLSTDDSQWGQWYVGNLATSLVPPESTVYVDDVTIRATP